MTTNTPTLQVSEFTGINNKTDPLALGLGGFVSADNVDVDDANRLHLRNGQTSLNTTAYRGAYATFDKTRCYAVTATGDLQDFSTDAAPVLRAGFVGYPYWVQIADIVFVGNENQCWRITPAGRVSDNALARPDPPKLTAVAGNLPAGQYRFVVVSVAGRESAPSAESIITVDGTQNIQVSAISGQRLYVAPANSKVFGWWRDTTDAALVYAATAEQLGEELRTLNLQPMPAGRCLAQYQGRLHCALYDPRTDVSVIYRSLPQWWDLCDPVQDMKLIPGEVRALAGVAGGLVVCTDRQIGYIDANDNWVPFADYGVPPGQPIAFDEKIPGEEIAMCWIWTQHGVLKALPFLEVTPQFAPPIADWVGACVVRERGDSRLVATLSPFDTADNAA